MKNLIISVLSMQIITGLPFWEYSKGDRAIIGVALMIVLWTLIESIDDAIMKRRRLKQMQKRRAKRFADDVIELTRKMEAM